MDFDELSMLSEARSLIEASKEETKLLDEAMICECMCLTAGMIRDFLGDEEVNLEKISQALGLGTGCSHCSKRFSQWKNEI